MLASSSYCTIYVYKTLLFGSAVPLSLCLVHCHNFVEEPLVERRVFVQPLLPDLIVQVVGGEFQVLGTARPHSGVKKNLLEDALLGSGTLKMLSLFYQTNTNSSFLPVSL